MKTIHIVLGRANPNRMNGVNRVAHNLATQQTLEGMDITIWGITDSYNKADEIERNYKTQWFPVAGKFKIDQTLQEAVQNTDEETVFHLHGGFIPVFYSLAKFLKKTGKKFFFTPHGTYTVGAMQNNSLVKKLYFKTLEKTVLKLANGVQCLGHAEASDLQKLNSKAKIALIPNGQNFDELRTDTPTKVDDQFIIGYCGRITMWQKGLDILLDSFEHYKNELKGIGKLHLIGDGEYLSEMRELTTKKGLTNDVIFHGSQFGEAKIHLLKNMKLFVHTSRNEGLPTAVIEAAALGIPCLVSDMTSMDTYVKKANAGYTYSHQNFEKIAKLFLAAEQDFHSGKAKELGENAEKMALENFDWSVIAHQTRAWYGT